jgi:alpha-ketoglutarate-dependent taurine dioxygenase
MKITKIPGLGRFGIFIDNLDFNTITDEEWAEIGKLHLESLVTIIRNVNIEPNIYESFIYKWGHGRSLQDAKLLTKYKISDIAQLIGQDYTIHGQLIDEEDKVWLNTVMNLVAVEFGDYTQMLRVSGKKDASGNPLGMFAEGDLLWHSNESGNLCFAPGVALLGKQGVVGSATGFLTTPDWYEEQSESFRSELDEMIIEHQFSPGRINPGLRKEQDDIMYRNMCPEDIELPLVISSPNNIKGLHYSVNTINSIKGMSKLESDKMFAYINKTLFVEKYIYDHWYQQDNDLCLFDNSITLHRRLGGIADRLAYRIQYDYTKIAPRDFNRYYQEPYASMYRTQLTEINRLLKIN